ncbi:site-specific DNA-methyltransferase (adenine-specific) [Moraxella cuniculi DSM 21768]|uniref:Methyltransferase n=1 Tax=Moraxella cuniculi DSM 21768 TaxID=1122245 RepID=A0A1N7E2J1_9GAMM|nr:site-specific DNA-methyltransferase [Moraxella cuniculi]OOS04632.1 site-specific DNA-methyltransferase [Moraxella cuniculi]SIR82284.1 site-specific DNA-methyltransferase (adenine-specific) [Moraxella cuniculi DSM 21768]
MAEYSVIVGDILSNVDKINENSIQVIVTSPPYFKLRKYTNNEKCEIGQEQNIECYIERLVLVFNKLRDKLRDDGVLFLNLGDTYINNSLMGIPWRVALALINDGWILRSDIIWHKPNAMPSSVKNRPTTDHEYVFMFVKNKNYSYYQDEIREPHITFSENSKMKGGRNHFGKRNGTPELGKNAGNSNLHNGRWDQAFHPLGRNKRTVWSISLGKYRGNHFAVFPEKLVETCIKAASQVGDLVCDPFLGSGTSGVVALKLSRNFIGVELVPEYAGIAMERMEKIGRDSSQNTLF